MAKAPAEHKKTKVFKLHKKGLSQRAISKKLKLSVTTVNKWLNEPKILDEKHLSLMNLLEAHIVSLIKNVDVNKIEDTDKSIHIIKAYEIYIKLAVETFKNNDR